MDAVRRLEHAKYNIAYAHSEYGMGDRRRADAEEDLAALPTRHGYLDVGCGRGEMLSYAQGIGFHPVYGTEVTTSLIGGPVVYGEAHALPFSDGSVAVASLFDVIEHLVPGDDEAVCCEMRCIATDHVLITANNRSSVFKGMELHINRRPYDEWDRLFRAWFEGATVHRLGAGRFNSERWRIDL